MATLFKSLSGRVPNYYTQKENAEIMIGRKLTNKEFEENYLKMPENQSSVTATGTSTFDPALCEIVYLWFSKKEDSVIDPFAGGSVRGVVASMLGRNYVGVDIRKEQIEANQKNAEDMGIEEPPIWYCGDSIHIQDIAPGKYDFMLTCPPYGDLEVYSDNPSDISNMDIESFDEAYQEIIRKTAEMLHEDRFAVIVVGNYRDKNGFMRDLCGLTIRAMESGGCKYYNDMVYVQTAGSLPIRCGKPFKTSRKIGKMHQYVLVFCKGDPKKAAQRLGDILIPDMEEFTEESLEQQRFLP